MSRAFATSRKIPATMAAMRANTPHLISRVRNREIGVGG
ncbi:Uncharacterised protein [Mycobacteroides abscessus subsp. abscessus]|nr:Uncharacterised protein [Mycobacteroides abscessus subsp. abscessus]